MKKILLLLLLFFIGLQAQDANTGKTNKEINDMTEYTIRALSNDEIFFGNQGAANDSTDSKTGKTWFRAKATAGEAIAVAQGLITVGTVTRCVVQNLSYFTDNNNYTLPDSTILYCPNAEFTGTISLGSGSILKDATKFVTLSDGTTDKATAWSGFKIDSLLALKATINDAVRNLTEAFSGSKVYDVVNTTDSVGTIISGAWNGTSIDTGYTDAKVISFNDRKGVVTPVSGDYNAAQITDLEDSLDTREPTFSKNTGFNKNYGNVAGTVKQGFSLADSAVTGADTLGGTSGIKGDIFFKAGSNIDITRDTDTLTIGSTGGGGGGALFVYKSANESVTSSTTFQDDDHLNLDVAANTTYHIEIHLIGFLGGTQSIKGQLVIDGGQAFDLKVSNFGTYNTDNNVLVRTQVGTGTTVSIISAGSFLLSNNPVLTIRGYLITGSAGGNIKFQWAQQTSDANSTTLQSGSYMKMVN
jgi:hypothetical protein